MEIQEAIVVADDQPQDHSPEPTHQFSMLRLTSTDPPPSSATTAVAPAAVCDHLLLHPPCTACGCQGFNSMKKRSPETDLQSSRAKKPSREQDACDLTRRCGFTAISLPASLETLPILRRCISDLYTPPSSSAVTDTPFTSPENVTPPSSATAVTSPENVTPSSAAGSPSSASASRLPPCPPSLKRCVSDPVRSPSKTISHVLNLGETGYNNMEADFSKDETSKSSMRLKRMKDCFKEMRQWCDEVMQEDEQLQQTEDADNEGDKEEGIVCGSGEEVVSVEWVEKCLSINFKCPCGEGYQILLSGNKCYYKLI